MNLLITKGMHLQRCTVSASGILKHANYNISQPHHQQRRNFTQEFWLGVSQSAPVAVLQESITQLHDLTGLPWWSSIMLSTFLLRGAITFPLAIYQSKILAKVEKLQDEMPAIVKELKMETAYGMKKFKWTEKQARLLYNSSLKKQWNNLIVRDNCHPAKATIIIWFQIPLWITQSWAIRNLIYMQPDPTLLKAQMITAEMLVGGFGWIPNLTELDHSYILPVMLGVINLSIIEIQNMSKKTQINSKLQKYATNFFRVICVGMVPIATMVPSGLCLYWVSSSVFGLAQNLAVLSPKLKRIARIPKVNSELEKPYTFLLDQIKKKIS